MLVVTVFAAYAFARLDFKGKNLTFALFAGAMLFCGCSRQEEHPMNKALKEASENRWQKADKP